MCQLTIEASWSLNPNANDDVYCCIDRRNKNARKARGGMPALRRDLSQRVTSRHREFAPSMNEGRAWLTVEAQEKEARYPSQAELTKKAKFHQSGPNAVYRVPVEAANICLLDPKV